MVDSRAKAPLADCSERARSMEYLTSSAVIGSPLAKVSCSRRVQA
jgi:hypothetical protein